MRKKLNLSYLIIALAMLILPGCTCGGSSVPSVNNPNVSYPQSYSSNNGTESKDSKVKSKDEGTFVFTYSESIRVGDTHKFNSFVYSDKKHEGQGDYILTIRENGISVETFDKDSHEIYKTFYTLKTNWEKLSNKKDNDKIYACELVLDTKNHKIPSNKSFVCKVKISSKINTIKVFTVGGKTYYNTEPKTIKSNSKN